MKIDTKAIFSITEANQNFSKVARKVDELGSVGIIKTNAPRYRIIDFSKAEAGVEAPDEDVLAISQKLIEENREAYEVLAQ